jgi:hypothetical protein
MATLENNKVINESVITNEFQDIFYFFHTNILLSDLKIDPF